MLRKALRQFSSKVAEPLTITQLHSMGQQNLALTKILNYEDMCSDDKIYRSFEEEINRNFIIQKTEPIDRHSKRVGLLGYKMGMTHFWDRWGVLTPCTVVQIDRCQVTQVKELQHISTMQVGCGDEKLKKLKKPQAGHFLKYGLPPKKALAEFVVTPENFLPIGYALGPSHFHLGQWIDVQSTSKGKGF